MLYKREQRVFKNVLFCIIICVVVLVLANSTNHYEQFEIIFPEIFMWAVATSSYQIEGAWNKDGKGLNIWDAFTHANANKLIDKSNGDISCNSYDKYMDDIEIIKEMGVKYYRMSISWARILPRGVSSEGVNKEGIQYYRTLFKTLKDEGIEPMVTLYHWDYPQILQKRGGWLNENSSDWFCDYAHICFQAFSPYVDYWFTIHDPYSIAVDGYGSGTLAPGIKSCPNTCPYIVGHNLLLAHAKAFQIYKDKFYKLYAGKVSIALSSQYYVPGTDQYVDFEASYNALQFEFGWFASPVIYGEYPMVMQENIMAASQKAGLRHSRLPKFSTTESALLRGSFNFLSLNMYTASYAFVDKEGETYSKVRTVQDTKWPSTGSPSLKATPWAMKELLVWIKKHFRNPMILISANGFSDSGTLQDYHRIDYLHKYILNVRLAMDEGCKVIGYTVWSLMDTFQWTSGYSERFGLYHVNFTSENRTRTARLSAKFYANIVKNSGINLQIQSPFIPEPTENHIHFISLIGVFWFMLSLYFFIKICRTIFCVIIIKPLFQNTYEKLEI